MAQPVSGDSFVRATVPSPETVVFCMRNPMHCPGPHRVVRTAPAESAWGGRRDAGAWVEKSRAATAGPLPEGAR